MMFPQSRMSSRMAGVYKSIFAPGEKTDPKSNVSGSTPITVTAVPSKLMLCPTKAGFPANCLSQKA